jgi:hypothetical protein
LSPHEPLDKNTPLDVPASSNAPEAVGQAGVETKSEADPRDKTHTTDTMSDRPSQVDFALLTINESEGDAVRLAFKDCLSGDRTLVGMKGAYEWGRTEESPHTRDHIFVHASTRDWKGPIPTIEMIRELVRLFSPQYLLVLGTAGGVKSTRAIEYGQIVFSRQIHTGYVQLVDGESVDEVKASLYDDPVPPPHKGLYFQAVEVSQKWVADPKLNECAALCMRDLERLKGSATGTASGREAPPEPDISGTLAAECAEESSNAARRETSPHDESPDLLAEIDRIVASLCRRFPAVVDKGSEALAQGANESAALVRPEPTEFYSGPFLIDGRNSRIFHGIQTTFPKVGAVEMEAGAVAQALQHSSGSGGPAGYLVIKGLSDIIYSKVPAARRRDVRKALAPLASLGSALFARKLIESWKGETEERVGKLRLLPPKYGVTAFSVLKGKQWSNSVVFYKVGLSQYSRLLKRLCEGERVTSAWIFSYLAPCRFFDDPRFKTGRKTEEVNADVRAQMKEHLFSEFPHFNVFLKMSKSKGKKVTRIIHRGQGWKEKNKDFIEVFGAVNGTEIECFVLEEDGLKQEDRWPISDQIVLNGDLLLNYWFEDERHGNGTLTITYLDEGEARDAFATFRSHCDSLCKDETKYDNVIKEILSESKPVKRGSGKKSPRTPRH